METRELSVRSTKNIFKASRDVSQIIFDIQMNTPRKPVSFSNTVRELINALFL
ncbi:MAG: hypothetical protein OEZ38_07200 [Gammaproteobacteria bacterium]|nr:hypothetical protein [Gammaproteobacteria bacterium]